MRTILLSAVIAFAVTVIIGMPMINWLRKMKFGQKILEIGPKWHMNKQNIPTMGGFMFIIGIAASVAIMAVLFMGDMLGAGGLSAVWNYLAVLLIALAYGAIGMIDDWAKIRKKQNAGLGAKQKLLLQIVVAAVFLSLLRLTGSLSAWIWVPGTALRIDLPWMVYLAFAIVVIVGCDNAVNLTDGIDGLAASVTVPVAVFFALVGARTGNLPVAVFAGALAGALLAFLVFNFNPAKVFMGDTGSLFLGGAVAGLAFACDMPLILLPIGIIYIIETISVILQVTYFKATGGKRLFKMAPVHHHFEMCGWSERQIVGVFTAVTTIMCLLAWMLLPAVV